MRRARKAVRASFALGSLLGLLGCGNSSSLRFPLPSAPRLTARARQEAAVPRGPELRIADGAVAQVAPEIPIVPVPLPPYGKPTPKKREVPVVPVVPVAAPKEEKPPIMPIPSGPATPPKTTTSLPIPPQNGRNNMRLLQREAAQRMAAIDCYIARLTRREHVRGREKPEELILFKYRNNPWSIYFKWLTGEGQGREMVYVKGRHDNKLHILLASGDIPLMPAGKRITLAPDSVLVRSASRHPIVEAGIAANIDRLGAVLDALDRGDKRLGTLTDLGMQVRPEYGGAVPAIEHILPGGIETDLPDGGRRVYYFDPNTQLPQLVVTRDPQGKEVEYYRYDRLQVNVNLDDQDFDPDKLWGRPAPIAPTGN